MGMDEIRYEPFPDKLLRKFLGAVTKLPVLFFYFVTAPYAVPSVYLTKLLFDNGLEHVPLNSPGK